MRMPSLMLSLVLIVLVSLAASAQEAGKPPTYADALKSVKIPPDWLAGVQTTYDTSKPWKEARLHIRDLLRQGGPAYREGIKLTYLYLVEKKAAEPSEYPMYVYLGREFAWAAVVYEDWLRINKMTEAVEYRHLASCQQYFGEPQKALETLRTGLQRLKNTPQRAINEATLHDCMGDVYAATGDKGKAGEEYRKALDVLAKMPKPQPKVAAKTQAKLEMLTETLNLAKVPDGSYKSSAVGYVKDVQVTVQVKGGKISDVQVQHGENLEAGSTKTIPQRIIEKQTPNVDAVTAATITSQAITTAAWQALKAAQKP
jgi:uncharacterized protein with FMN-binding domain